MKSFRLPDQTELKEEQKEAKSTSSSGLILITKLKKPAEDKSPHPNRSNLTFTDGLRIIPDFKGTENLTEFYIAKGETAESHKTSTFNPSDKYFCTALIPISTTRFGLVFCESYKVREWSSLYKFDAVRVKSIIVIDVKNAKTITQINLPDLPEADGSYVCVRTFPRNPNYYAIAYKNKCWIYNSENYRWKEPHPSNLANIQNLIVFHNNDLAIVNDYSNCDNTFPRKRYVYLNIFHINLMTEKVKLKFALTLTNPFLQNGIDTQLNCATSPVSSSHFIFNRRLFNIIDNELIHVDIPLVDTTDEIDLLEWLSDGSMIGRTKKHRVIQILMNNRKIEVIVLEEKIKDLYVYPDGKVLVQSPRDAALFEVSTVLVAQKNMSVKPLVFADEQFLHSIYELLPIFSLSLLRIMIEYLSENECEQLGKAKYFSIYARDDMDAKLGEKLILLHSNLEAAISKASRYKYVFFATESGATWIDLSYTFEEKVMLKLALEFFVGLLNQKKPFVDCIIEALASRSFDKEMITLGKEIPALGVEIAKLIPHPALSC